MFIRKILTNTFNYSVENKKKILDSLKYPAIGIFITSLFGSDSSHTFAIQNIILFLAKVYFSILFTVNCHRLFLDQKVPNGLVETLKWNIRDTSFLLKTIGFVISLGFYAAIISIILIAIPGNINGNNFIFMFIVILPVGYKFSRLSLILPATAIDQNNSWSMAWNISEGNGWNLCVLIAIIPFLIGFAINSINSTSIVAKVLTSIFSIVILFYEITILSNSYKMLSSKTETTQQDTSPESQGGTAVEN